MIKVVIIDDKRIIESVHESPDETIRLAWAQEGAESRGYCIFRSGGELLYIVDKDNIFELLVRAALNHLDLNNVKTAFSKNPAMLTQLKTLGFKEGENGVEVNIKEFFKPCGGCK